MKNLKRILGLMTISGIAFGFAGNVSATTTVVGKDVASCLKSAKDTTAVCTLTESQEIDGDVAVTGNVTLNLKEGVVLTLKEHITITGSLKINGNGGTIKDVDEDSVNTLIVKEGGSLTADNVSIISETTSLSKPTQAVIAVYGDNTTTNKTTVSIGSKAKVEGYAGLIVYPEDSDSSSIKGNTANNVTIDLNGTWNTTSYVIQVQGVIKNASRPTVINVNGGSYTSEHNTALYASGLGNWTITDAKVTGTEALVVKGGTVTIKGGEFTANGDGQADTGLDGSVQSNAGWTGAAVAVVGNASYAGKIKLEIDGGKFTSEKRNALYFDGQNSQYTSVKVNDGTFVSPEDQEALFRTSSIVSNLNGIVYGGTFEGKTSALASGKALAKDLDSITVDGVTYVGKEHTVTLNGVNEDQTILNGKVESLSTPKNVVAGQPISIEDIVKVVANEGYVVKYTILDANNKEVALTDGKFVMPNSDVTITLSIVSATQDPSVGDDNKPGTGDNQPSENPKTFDAIGSLVTMAISSLGVVGTTIKKVLK